MPMFSTIRTIAVGPGISPESVQYQDSRTVTAGYGIPPYPENRRKYRGENGQTQAVKNGCGGGSKTSTGGSNGHFRRLSRSATARARIGRQRIVQQRGFRIDGWLRHRLDSGRIRDGSGGIRDR